MEVTQVKTYEIQPSPKNRNVHSVEQIERLCKLIRFQGFRVPIIISNQTGHIVAGHGRLEAAKVIGLETVPVSYQDFKTEDEEQAFRVSDNEIARWAELDLSSLNTDVADFGPEFDMELLGLKKFEIEPPPEKKKKLKSCPSCGHEF